MTFTSLFQAYLTEPLVSRACCNAGLRPLPHSMHGYKLKIRKCGDFDHLARWEFRIDPHKQQS
jgi:hypothetical protein